MEITAAQFNRIEQFLPVQRGNVSLSNLQVVNAILYVAENGCKWRALPKRLGNWHTIYTRMNRWAKAGVSAKIVWGAADPGVPLAFPLTGGQAGYFSAGREPMQNLPPLPSRCRPI